MELNLQDIREQLDEIDDQMIDLFSRRMRLVSAVAAYKNEKGLPILDTGREKAILGRLSQKAGDELAPYVRRLYQDLFTVSREYQKAQLDQLGEML